MKFGDRVLSKGMSGDDVADLQQSSLGVEFVLFCVQPVVDCAAILVQPAASWWAIAESGAEEGARGDSGAHCEGFAEDEEVVTRVQQ